MPVVSDFTIITSNDFVTRSRAETKQYSFNTGGRHNSPALVDLSLLGGSRSGDQNMSVRVLVNGRAVGTPIVNRWQSHGTIVHDRINLVVPVSVLTSSGNNLLRLEPRWEADNDYLFVGPVVCHFHQAA